MRLPEPGAGFAWVAGPRPYLVCTALADRAVHAFTTRAWVDGDASSEGQDGLWRQVASIVGLGPERLARAVQVHGATVIPAAEAMAHRSEADVLTADDPSVAVAIQTADCVPLLLADDRGPRVAAAHAGWRGIASGAPAAAVAALVRGGSAAANLVAAVGPAIGPCCYEVGPDVRTAVGEWVGHDGAAPSVDDWFHPRPVHLPHNESVMPPPRQGHWCFDAWAAVRWQLQRAGVRPDRIFVASLCTASHPEQFFSYRRDGAGTGRMVAVIRGGGPGR